MESQATTKGTLSSFPQMGTISFPQGPIGTPVPFYKSKAYLQNFLKGEPKVLGTVQIMIALMNFALGMIIILLPSRNYIYENFILNTGYIFWGTAFFLVSGSLAIAAENKTTNTLVQSSLAMNTVSAVAAGLGIIILSINLAMNDSSYYSCIHESPHETCVCGLAVLLGIGVILLILAIFELAFSLEVLSFGCKATCCSQSGVTIFMPSPSQVPVTEA
ncbi:membrane-spanning 4-domains subfamily A member 4A-like [Monodelphis domestica]|uniref:membrane-spanning 4-domains subfamily A member 4A-like n=1 Tax=Monodelphis domestica TaxID=13616 RepID=UPI0024E247C5|nr:membrane-spanning 4-domains subfamily A member 4A-like [Monodelphis domestica]